MSDDYIRAAAIQIATPRVPPAEIPGSFNEKPLTTPRQVSGVRLPVAKKPTEDEFFVYDHNRGRMPSHTFLRNHFFNEGRLTDDQALYILHHARETLSREPNMLQVQSPVTVCGDIHGQFYDLMKIFEVGGNVEDSVYLFLGDYVDRGSFGIECLLYLYVLKLWYPTRIHLLRGNHECKHLTEYFTFKRECLHKYSEDVYNACVDSFNALPVTALLDKRFFCVHGGISPELNTLQDLERIDRFRDPGGYGLLCDLLWADPIPDFGHEQDPSAHAPIPAGTTFVHNGMRGCSFYYTYAAVCAFLERNNLLGVIRGHEAQDAGFKMYRKTPKKKFPSVITVFSAPNYCDAYHNRGAVLKYANKNITIRQYNANPHPYWLPNFMDAFTWSLPFVGEKIVDMLLAILTTCSDEELEQSSSEESTDVDSDGAETRTIADLGLTPTEISKRREQIRNKILDVGLMQRVFTILRQGAENATELAPAGGMLGEGCDETVSPLGVRLGPNVLGVHGNHTFTNFNEARKYDIANERLPNFDYDTSHGSSVGGVSSMRSLGDTNMEELIKKVMQETENDLGAGVVEKLADRIARDRKPQGRPRALKRFETA